MGLCQEAIENLDSLEKEIAEELAATYQQNSLDGNNMDEIDQSEDQGESLKIKNRPN